MVLGPVNPYLPFLGQVPPPPPPEWNMMSIIYLRHGQDSQRIPESMDFGGLISSVTVLGSKRAVSFAWFGLTLALVNKCTFHPIQSEFPYI